MVNLCVSAPIPEPFLPNIFYPHGLLPFGHSDTGFLGTYSGFGPFRNFPFDKGYPFGNNNSYKQNPFNQNPLMFQANFDDDHQESSPAPIYFHSSSSPNHHQVTFSVYQHQPIDEINGSKHQEIHEIVKGVFDNFFTSLLTGHNKIFEHTKKKKNKTINDMEEIFEKSNAEKVLKKDEKDHDSDKKIPSQHIDTQIANLNDILDALDTGMDLNKQKSENDFVGLKEDGFVDRKSIESESLNVRGDTNNIDGEPNILLI